LRALAPRTRDHQIMMTTKPRRVPSQSMSAPPPAHQAVRGEECDLEM
jgi:hypothetical protein